MNRWQRWRYRHDAVIDFTVDVGAPDGPCVRAPSGPGCYPPVVKIIDIHAPLDASPDVYDVYALVMERRKLTRRFVVYRVPDFLRRPGISWSGDWRRDGDRLVLKAFAMIPDNRWFERRPLGSTTGDLPDV